MFDEVDEGTAIYKLANATEQLPVPSRMVHNNIDENVPNPLKNLPQDWYLQLTREMAHIITGERPMSDNIPLRP
ncbi:MAG: hypothetical protein HC901_03120 [Bdellovibrionaceae bacterium]|nr:hypothetical protein [Pseudobdellovibrionaceae bacterium]